MSLYRFTGRDAQGGKIIGSRESGSADSLASELLAERITPLTIEEQAQASDSDVFAQLKESLRRKHVDLEELIIFCRQMYSLSKAGVPIIRAIGGLAESSRNLYLREVLQAVRSDLEGGQGMAVALNAHPKVFNTLFVSMISVGENTGQLDQAFRQLSVYLELERETRKRIKQATRYPLFVLSAMAVALVVINLFVIPAFSKVFAQFKADLPWATQILIGTSQFFQDFWWLLALLFGGSLFGFFKWIETDAGALKWDQIKLRLPIVGGIFERIALARFTRTFAMMYRAGVPLLQTLSINSASVGNRYIGQAILAMREGIERGEALTRTASASGLFTPLVLQMMAVGEETGALDDLFVEVADFYEQEVDYDLKQLADAIEPILIVAMGIMVLVLALGVFLPMWELASAAKGGR
ncbi:MAG: type II secretion system F family protein [Pseudomonadales bacterium]|uniref:type II secretion system F family protein n=1 Tax=Pseudomonas sp. FEMGT703P TaxID=2080764 RepID=UPI000CAD5EF2|nr:type II secretion system F family protein [Pseudomonas sp. FEMGT703P]MBU1284023.1 type II secretion system F family protein [Gammaproteobacteria bacterium]MBU2064571.1 type II secretion system F family protein [Gammaproteobacteria bacterium]MBU2156570.1 type II secretion system F family protein [Gammaproteobacteria bacterium]MBU2254758.1 type II secretion system F family protein [Gammaproteobacteria bacterium]PJE44785.1 MAG: MSHA biogenesis protein MshG [Pseudomonas sp.] [Pseudomonas sp. FE